MSYKSKVLLDHLKKGGTFYPPFTFESGERSVQQVEWRADILPELLWLALVAKELDFSRAKLIVQNLGFWASKCSQSEFKPNFGLASGYASLSEQSEEVIIENLEQRNFLGDLQKALLPMICLFPECPLAFILADQGSTMSYEKAVENVGEVLDECLYRGEKLPTLAQGLYYDILRASGKLHIPSDLTDHKTETLVDYPNTKESEATAAFMRCCATSIPMEKDLEPNQNLLDWPKVFWKQASKIGECVPAEREGVFLSNLPQEYILYLADQFRAYSIATDSIWDSIVLNYEYDVYWSLRDDVLLGLATRIYRITIQIVSFTPNWTEDVGQVYLRMIVESFIYYSWLKKHGKKEDFEKLYDHGLGQQKLNNEHTKAYMQEHGLSEKDAESKVDSMDFLRGHKLPMFVPVNVGNPLGKNLGTLAEEADLREFHALVFSPTSAAVHGSYDNLDQHYLKECVNPFHCRHRIPYYWYKSPISLYGVLNSLSITDWLLEDLISHVGQEKPEVMPGRIFITNIQNERELNEFAGREDIKEQCRFFEQKIRSYSK